MNILRRLFGKHEARPEPVDREMKYTVLSTIISPHLQADPQKMCQALNWVRYSTNVILEILNYTEFELEDNRKRGSQLDPMYKNCNATYEVTMKGIEILRKNKRYLYWDV